MLSELLMKKFKNAVNDKISQARLDLMIKDGFYPIMLSSTAYGIEEAEINLDETPKEEAASLLRKYATSPQVEAIALIFISSTFWADSKNIPADINKEPNAIEAILALIYMKEATEYRRIPFKRNGDSDYWFGDEGWRKVDELAGLFANPFKGNPYVSL